MHVTDLKSFAAASNASYTPHDALLSDARKNAARLRVPNLVFVQPSTYGYDNSCLLTALRTMGPRQARGVVVLKLQAVEDMADRSFMRYGGSSTIGNWHKLGVRGYRINLKSAGVKMSSRDLLAELGVFARCFRPLQSWAMQVFVSLPEIAPVLEELVHEHLRGMRLVIDHFGLPEDISRNRLADVKGGPVLKKVLLEHPNVYVKASGPYRMSKDKDYGDLEMFTKDVFDIRGGQNVVFASDWPHTRFEGVDAMPWLERCLEWCDGDHLLAQRLFRDNAKVLWDVTDGEEDDRKRSGPKLAGKAWLQREAEMSNAP